MRWMIASDIHGSEYYCRKMLEKFEEEGADRLLLLGDLLYHGPRNDLPRDYHPKAVIELLNEKKERLLCVRGNCDAEVDQMVLQFPILADYAVLSAEDLTVYATHGHVYGEDNPPPLGKGDILLCGHTHVAKCEAHENFLYMNPGSVSIPKGKNPHSYLIWEKKVFVWKDLDGQVPDVTVDLETDWKWSEIEVEQK